MWSANPGSHILFNGTLAYNLTQRVKKEHSLMNSGNSEKRTGYMCTNDPLWPNQQCQLS